MLKWRCITLIRIICLVYSLQEKTPRMLTDNFWQCVTVSELHTNKTYTGQWTPQFSIANIGLHHNSRKAL